MVGESNLKRSKANKQGTFVVEINPSYCKLCGICVKMCPVKNLHMDEEGVIVEERCIGCSLCESYCPEGAIIVTKLKK